MKRYIAFLLATLMCANLCACGAEQTEPEVEDKEVQDEFSTSTEILMQGNNTKKIHTDIDKSAWTVKNLTLRYLNQEIKDKEKLYINEGKTVIEVLADEKKTKDYNVESSDLEICACSVAEQGQLILDYSGMGESIITIQIDSLQHQFVVCSPEPLMLQYKGKKYAPKAEIYLPFDEAVDSLTVLWNGEIYENYQTYTYLDYERQAASLDLQPIEPGWYPLTIQVEDMRGEFFIVYADPITGEIPQRVDYDPIIDYYQIPQGLGSPQYSADEIKKMIADDLTLDEVAAKISTVSDLVQYLHQKKYSGDNSGDIDFWWNNRKWGVNRNAQTVFGNNQGNCGGDSNLANYILSGDYDEQGYVQETANMGGHVYNYFKEDGIYYFIDLTLIIRSKGTYDNSSYRIYATTDPNEYSKYYIDKNHKQNNSKEEGYLLLHYMYERNGSHAPVGTSEVRTVCNGPYVVLSKEIENVVQFLYIDESVSEPKFVQSPPQSEWPKEAR